MYDLLFLKQKWEYLSMTYYLMNITIHITKITITYKQKWGVGADCWFSQMYGPY